MRVLRILLSALVLLICTNCERQILTGPAPEGTTELPPDSASGSNGNASGNGIKTIPVTITSTLEQPSGATKTQLGNGNMVLWSAGDSFDLLPASAEEPGVKDVLVATVSSKSAGLGITVSSSSDHYVRYEGVRVTVGGQDVTSDITGTASNTSNSYLIGIYNSEEKYQYAPAGTTMAVNINNSNGVYTMPLVQSSSKASITPNKQAIVTLTGLQYSSDNTNWTAIDETTTLSSGFGGKGTISYEWQYREGTVEPVTRTTATITTDEPCPAATFDADIYEETEYYAVYPASSANSISDGTISFRLPQTQTYAEGTFAIGANPAVGHLTEKDGEYSVSMKNVCGALKLKLKGEETVTAIKVTDPDETHSLWGEGSMDTEGIGEAAATFTGGSNSVILDCGDGVGLDPDEETEFIIVVPEGSFEEGLTVTVTTLNGVMTKSTGLDNTVLRSMIRTMPAFTVEDVVTPDPEPEEFSIENPAVAEYLANSTATLTSASSNYGQSFFDQSRNYRPDQPNVKTITFTGGSTSSATVTMSENPDHSDPVLTAETPLTDGAGSYVLRNMVPGRTYHYSVSAGGKILTGGAITVTGQLRMIAIDYGFNIRDLGGWTGWNGNKVRYEAVYRGASLGGSDRSGSTSDISQTDKEELLRIGIRAQLDLRASSNAGKYPNETSLHSYSRGATTLLDADFNNTMTDYGAYNEDASVIADIAWIIYELKLGKPVYFNCRQGADRTGTIAFIIEGLLGCYGSDNGRQMGMDYELTGFSQANLIDNLKVETSYRSAREAATNSSKLFYQLLNLSASGISLGSLQEKCYYYLNRYAGTSSSWGRGNSTQMISKEDLDWFINYMLGLVDIDGTVAPGHSTADLYTAPSWAQSTGLSLKSIGESKMNVVNYVQ